MKNIDHAITRSLKKLMIVSYMPRLFLKALFIVLVQQSKGYVTKQHTLVFMVTVLNVPDMS